MPNFPATPDSTGTPYSNAAVPLSPQHPCTPPELNTATWEAAARRLLAKMLGEFAYEEILSPAPAGSASATSTGSASTGRSAATSAATPPAAPTA
ncbi:hypothetical protein OV450_8290, partial [Actinobacteria bacterium OV450]